MAKGIDVYTAYQNVTDWGAVRRAGYEYVYVKVSDGNTNRAVNGYGTKAKNAGIKGGAYHYAQPGNPVGQANRLVDQAEANDLVALAPALDIESNPKIHTWGVQEAIDFSIAFLRQVKARGHRPCIYANNSMLTAILGPIKAAVPDVLVWVARYGANPTVTYDLWQHSDQGSVPGIQAGSVDLNTGIIPLNTSTPTSGGFLMALSDADQKFIYDKVKDIDATLGAVYAATGGKQTFGPFVIDMANKVNWMFSILGNTPDTNGDGKSGDLSLVGYRQWLVDTLKAIDAKLGETS